MSIRATKSLFDQAAKLVAERDVFLLEEYIIEQVIPRLCAEAIPLLHIIKSDDLTSSRRHIFYCSKCEDKIGDYTAKFNTAVVQL